MAVEKRARKVVKGKIRHLWRWTVSLSLEADAKTAEEAAMIVLHGLRIPNSGAAVFIVDDHLTGVQRIITIED